MLYNLHIFNHHCTYIYIYIYIIMTDTPTSRLAKWATNLQYEHIPTQAIQRTKELYLDWLGCTIAGRNHPAVSAIVKYAIQMGPTTGNSELVDGSLGITSSSPAFASLVNGASSHVVEQDDLHNRSIMHPVCSLLLWFFGM